MVKSVHADSGMELMGAVGPKDRDYIGDDTGLVANLGRKLGVPVSDNLEEIIDHCDLVLDCTQPETAMDALNLCIRYNKAFVSGTTGFTDEQREAFKAAGTHIPVILAYNTSRMMHLLFDAVRQVAATMGARADIDIVDIHDRGKPDAPSGTAKEIAGIVCEELGTHHFTYGRKGMGIREDNSIAFNSIRSGGYPGAVKVIFGFDDEQLTLSGQVFNMDTYAKGMIDAGLFLNGKSPGFYDLKEVFHDNE